jgi:hypothetical protein
LGKIAREEAREIFRQQVNALVEGGVDLIMLETFGYLEELHQAVLACRDVSAKLPVVAQVTIDEDGNCLDGSDTETFTQRLTDWGVEVIGCNCSVGPVAMLDAIERVRAATSLPLSAQPNAGVPRSVEGRNIYLCSPEYMASYARKFVAAGVRLVGGCCGTTPEHIRAMKSALRVGEARVKTVHGDGLEVTEGIAHEVDRRRFAGQTLARVVGQHQRHRIEQRGRCASELPVGGLFPSIRQRRTADLGCDELDRGAGAFDRLADGRLSPAGCRT